MALFKAVQGKEKVDSKGQSVMLTPGTNGSPEFKEGWVYVTSDKGNMYVDLKDGSTNKRIKIGSHADTADSATKDSLGLHINNTYIKNITLDSAYGIVFTKGNNTSTTLKPKFAASDSNGGAALTAYRLLSLGNHVEEASNSDKTIWISKHGMVYPNGMYMTQTYQDANTPAAYGNIINLAGSGAGQLLLEWTGGDGTQTGHIFYRDQRDCLGSGDWHPWKQVAYTDGNIASATKATNDSLNQSIIDTYIKNITLVDNGSQPVYTLTKGNNTTASVNLPVANENNAGVITTGAQTIAGAKTFTSNITANKDVIVNQSIRNLAVGGGIYWNPYVESSTDASDVASITVIKNGVGGGTELRISQLNDANDVINLYAPRYIYLRNKKAFDVGLDNWLRINDTESFSNGIYFGTSIARTDKRFEVGGNGQLAFMDQNGDIFAKRSLHVGSGEQSTAKAESKANYSLYVKGTSWIEGTLWGEHFYPGNDNQYNLGNRSKRWNSAYIGRNVITEIPGVETGGAVLAALAKGAGYPVYSEPEFGKDNVSVAVYNNSSNGTVTIARIDDTTSGNSSGKILKVTHTGTASPNLGGFVLSITSRANAVFLQIFRAKLPTGYSFNCNSNTMGKNYIDHFLTSTAGTGRWEWYVREVICGNTGPFSMGGHVSVSGSPAPTASAPLVWYLSYANVIDLTKGNYDGLITRYADNATKDSMNQIISSTYIKEITYNKHSTAPNYTITRGSGDVDKNPLTIPIASISDAGVVTAAGEQSFAGNKTFTNKVTITQADGFNYSGIQNGTANAARVVWFSASNAIGEPCKDAKFTYNPAASVQWSLDSAKVTVGLLKADRFEGLASTALKDTSGNLINTYFKAVKLTGEDKNTPTYVFTRGNSSEVSIKAPIASETIAGAITTSTQTLTGAKTLNKNGSLTIIKEGGFNYSGIQTASGKTARSIWFSTADNKGIPAIHSKFTYIPDCDESWSDKDNATIAKGNEYGVVIADRFKGLASQAVSDAGGNIIRNTYFADVKVAQSDGSNLIYSFWNKNGVAFKNTITIPLASTSKAGIVSTVAQTFAGAKTFNGQIISAVDKNTAPFIVTSNIKVTNLNADLVDGCHVSNTKFTWASPSSALIPTQAAIKDSFNDFVSAIKGMRYKGAITPTSFKSLSVIEVGDTYVISSAGDFNGQYGEIGDLIICATKSSSTSSTWNIIECNLTGAISNSAGKDASSTNNSVTRFDGTTGRFVKGSKISIDDTGHLTPSTKGSQNLGNSDYRFNTVYGTTFNGTTFTGNAATATKLAAAKTINLNGNLTGSASFDGSKDITITAYNYQAAIDGGNTKNYPWHRIASCGVGTSQYIDKTALLRIRHTYNTGGEGLIKISVRTNSTDAACQATAVWLYRYNIPEDAVAVGLWGVTGQQVYADVYYNANQNYPRAIVESISNGRVYTLIASNEADNTTTSDKKTSVECYTSVANGGILARKQDYTSITYSVDGVSSTANAASMLATARNINGTAFNGTANIVTSYWGTARNITVGNTTKSVNGSANVSWSLSEIGAAAASHSHSYLPLSGGTMTGSIIRNPNSTSWIRMAFGDEGSGLKSTVAASNDGALALWSVKTNTGAWGCGGLSGNNNLYFCWGSDTNHSAGTNSANSSIYFNENGYIYSARTYGAVWNDYAEYRKTKKEIIPGKCVIETGKGDLIISTERLQPGANIVSDTFGFAIGETEKTKTPLAVSGRVLAYPYENRDSYQAGDPVCSGPNGTISKMTREEVREYPDRIVGTVSEIPNYEEWGTGKVKVNGRIWIKVK